MFRRWLIRSSFLCLLALCIAGWAASSAYVMSIDCYFARHSNWLLGLSRGRIWLLVIPNPGPDSGFYTSRLRNTYQYLICESTNPTEWKSPVYRLLGFALMLDRSGSLKAFCGIPFWFPTLLLSFSTAYAWRKTRPNPHPQSAFPIELSRDSGVGR